MNEQMSLNSLSGFTYLIETQNAGCLSLVTVLLSYKLGLHGFGGDEEKTSKCTENITFYRQYIPSVAGCTCAI